MNARSSRKTTSTTPRSTRFTPSWAFSIMHLRSLTRLHISASRQWCTLPGHPLNVSHKQRSAMTASAGAQRPKFRVKVAASQDEWEACLDVRMEGP